MVIPKSKPKSTWMIAISIPPTINQMTFMVMERQEDADSLGTTVFPKGQAARKASLKICLPNGIPTMVMHSKKPNRK